MHGEPDQTQSENNIEAMVLAKEREYVDAWRSRTGRQNRHDLTGLSLSGGGIRSAVFCLGVLQALARRDILKNFDYLSTVSGGGYIGSSLTWFTRHGGPDCGVGATDFPYGIDDPTRPPPKLPPGRPLLRYLRRHGSYLDPGGTMSMLPGVAIVLRGLFLNLLVWLPIATAFFVGIRIGFRAAAEAYPGAVWLRPFVIAAIPAAAFAILAIGYSLYSGYRSGRHKDMPYPLRRGFEKVTPPILQVLGVLLVLASLPYVQALLGDQIAKQGVGLVFTVAGAAMGLWSRIVPKGNKADTAVAWTGPIGAALMIYGVGLLAYALSGDFLPKGHLTLAPAAGICLLVLFSVALAVGLYVDLNETTLHRFYRDRLMEAFMPDTTCDAVPKGYTASEADGGRLHEMCDPADPRAPYHLINAHLVLTQVKGRNANDQWADRWRIRGGDNFVFAPRYCGGGAAGWHETTTNKSLSEISLATAMAVSGAAVNPDAAPDGVGPERNTLFAILMGLLNIRLGYWLPNPNRNARKLHAAAPNHFTIGWAAVRDRLSPKGWFLELTDGGHFENLAVYELLRRKVRTIVVCDAGADPDTAFVDLQNLLDRAEADFGVTITFPPPPLRTFMPAAQPGRFPLGVAFATAPFAIGEIRYKDGSWGKIYYLKPAIFPDLRLHVLGYKGSNPDFPDDSTLNQFFDEARFEAYRELGFACAEKMLEDPLIRDALMTM